MKAPLLRFIMNRFHIMTLIMKFILDCITGQCACCCCCETHNAHLSAQRCGQYGASRGGIRSSTRVDHAQRQAIRGTTRCARPSTW